MQEHPYRLLSPEHFRALAALDTAGPPIVSLYLQLTPERRVASGWRSALSALSHRISQTTDQSTRASVNADIEDIQGALDHQLPELGRGAAFFACRERGIWRQIALPIPLPDSIQIGPRPYLRPLLRTWGRSDRMLLALVAGAEPLFRQPSRHH